MPVTTAPIYPTAGWMATDYGYKAMAFDPCEATSTSVALVANGTIHFTRVPVRTRTLITNVILHVFTAGATLTANQCLAALYDPNGNLLSATGNQATAWTTAGTKVMALTAPQDCPPGLYDVAYFANGTTRPAFLRTVSDGTPNLGLTGNAIRFGTDSTNTARTTTFPATLGTKSYATTSGVHYWAGLS
jgi:hypothetical protein